MPFDNAREDTILNNLVVARKLIENPKHHLMHNFKVHDPAGVQRCSYQALADTLLGPKAHAGITFEVSESPEMALLVRATAPAIRRQWAAEPRMAVCATNNQGHDKAMKMYGRAIAARKKELRNAV